MPKYKAIIIPQWVTNMKAAHKLADETLLDYLPAMMHWRNADWMILQLIGFTPSTGLRVQLRDVVEHVKSLFKNEGMEDLVARITPMQNIPYHLMISFAPDVPKPVSTGQLVLRIDDFGRITELAREYTMTYATSKS